MKKAKRIKRDCVYLITRNDKPYRWIVRVTDRGERRYLGCFMNQEEATTAYQKWKIKNAR